MTYLAAVCVVAVSVGTGDTLEVAALDRQIFDVLREVHNRGADLHNAGDPVGCYRLYQGSLMTLKPLLAHRPAVQKAIDDALQAAERRPSAGRALVLHKAIVEARTRLKPAAGPPTNSDTPAPGVVRPALPSPTPLPPGTGPVSFPDAAAANTLWNRLGGDKKVEKIVDDWVNKCVADPKVNLGRDGKFALTEDTIATMKSRFTGYVSSISDGTAIPTREPLKDAHAAANFKPEEYAALVDNLRAALKAGGASDADSQALAKKVEDGRSDVLGSGEKPPAPQ
jgi:truncated hemoglobin YjbI